MPVIVHFDVAGAGQGSDREAAVGPLRPAAGRRLALDQRHRGALAPEDLLGARHRRHGEGRHQQRPRRERRLRPEQPHLDVPRRRLGDQQDRRRRRTGCGLRQRRAGRAPLPVSAGKPGFTTRVGDQGHHREVPSQADGLRRPSASSEGDPEYYDIDDVEYAMRVTYSGEFLHAAPWSVGVAGLRQRQPRMHRA